MRNNVIEVVGAAGIRNAIDQEQRLQLHHQIRAYKFLSRNLPIPPDVVKSMGGLSMKQVYKRACCDGNSDRLFSAYNNLF
jgi:hypothetical protein